MIGRRSVGQNAWAWAYTFLNRNNFTQACYDMRNKHKDKGYKRAAQNISGISMRYILELGKSSSILIGKFSSLVLFICLFLVACNEKGYVQRPLPSLEAVNDMANQSFQLDANKIRQHK